MTFNTESTANATFRSSPYYASNWAISDDLSSEGYIINTTNETIHFQSVVVPKMNVASLISVSFRNSQGDVSTYAYTGGTGVWLISNIGNWAPGEKLTYEFLRGALIMPKTWTFDINGRENEKGSGFVSSRMPGRTRDVFGKTFDSPVRSIFYDDGETQYFRFMDPDASYLAYLAYFAEVTPWNTFLGGWARKGEPALYKLLDMTKVNENSVINFYKHSTNHLLGTYTAATKQWTNVGPVVGSADNAIWSNNTVDGLSSFPFDMSGHDLSGTIKMVWENGNDKDEIILGGIGSIAGGTTIEYLEGNTPEFDAPSTAYYDASDIFLRMKNKDYSRRYINEISTPSETFASYTMSFDAETKPANGFSQDTLPANGFA
jgi:hypothetical protein